MKDIVVKHIVLAIEVENPMEMRLFWRKFHSNLS